MREEIEAIRRHYNTDPQQEWDRLKKRRPYEKYITIHMMDRFIQPNNTILDVGGGPGHYSIHYARLGHNVTLLDLSEENVRFAKKKAKQYGVRLNAMQGDAMNLSRFPDNSFDVVFLMGPLYHLMEDSNRKKAIIEAKRVLKPGGFLFSSFILMYARVIFGLREQPEIINAEQKKYQALFDITAKGESAAFESFTYSYMTTVSDAQSLIGSISGLQTITVFGQESILSPYKNILANSSRKIRQAWYDYAIRFCEREEYLTHTEHLMIVSVKKE